LTSNYFLRDIKNGTCIISAKKKWKRRKKDKKINSIKAAKRFLQKPLFERASNTQVLSQKKDRIKKKLKFN